LAANLSARRHTEQFFLFLTSREIGLTARASLHVLGKLGRIRGIQQTV